MWDASAEGVETYKVLFEGSANFQAVGPMLDAAGVTKGSRVLDVGSGLDAIAVSAALEREAIVTGSDVGETIVSMARAKFPGVEFEVADAADLPFADQSFDAVVCGFSIFAFREPDRALAEANRVLVPGGKLACTTWDWPVAGFDLFHEAMARHVPDEPVLAGTPPLMNVSGPAVLNGALRRAGFVETAVEHLPLVWELESPDRLFDALSSLRNFGSLDDETLLSFRSDVAQASATYMRRNRYVYPFPALLLSGSRSLD